MKALIQKLDFFGLAQEEIGNFTIRAATENLRNLLVCSAAVSLLLKSLPKVPLKGRFLLAPAGLIILYLSVATLYASIFLAFKFLPIDNEKYNTLGPILKTITVLAILLFVSAIGYSMFSFVIVASVFK